MAVSRLTNNRKNYKTALFRQRIIERLRLGMVTQPQVLTQLGISRTLLQQWNRTYQRYQLTWWFKPARFPRFVMKKPVVDPLKALQQKLAETEDALQKERLKNQALQAVIEVAENEFDIPIRKKSGSRR
ncbi:hypothetical protein GCM10027341_56670 [Spirosoma knui]